MRDDKWLFEKLDEIWDRYYPDVPQDNDVRIVWGRRARNRLGSIKQVPNSKLLNSDLNRNSKPARPAGGFINHKSNRHPVTIITINSLFKDQNIPEYVVTGTIAHELAHYAHGFHSPLEQKYDTPHAGGVVHREMDSRGLADIHRRQKKWLKENWRDYLEEKMPRKNPKRRRVVIRWI